MQLLQGSLDVEGLVLTYDLRAIEAGCVQSFKLAAQLRLQLLPAVIQHGVCALPGLCNLQGTGPAAAGTDQRSAAALAAQSELPGPWLLPIARQAQVRGQVAGQLLDRPRSSAAGWEVGPHRLGSTGCSEACGQPSAALERGVEWPVEAMCRASVLWLHQWRLAVVLGRALGAGGLCRQRWRRAVPGTDQAS